MALIPLPTGFSGITGLPRARENLVNLLPGVISRPGIFDWKAHGLGPCRASFIFRDLLYHVSGNDLIKINSSGGVSVVGYIGGTKRVRVAVDFAAASLVVEGGKGYVLTDTGVTENTSPQFLPCRDVVVVGGRFVYVPYDGGPLFYSEVGQPDNIDPLAFFDAETLPDLNIGVASVNGDLIALGASSIEQFRNTGPAEAPFRAVVGGTLDTGYVGGRVKYAEDALMFIGKDENAGFGVFTSAGGGRVSNAAVDEVLQGYSESTLREAIGNRFTWNGLDCVVFHILRNTLVYVNGAWVNFTSGFDGRPWDVRHITFAYGRHIVGMSDARIGYLSDVDDDFGDKMDRYLDTFYRSAPQSNFTLGDLEAQITFRRDAGSLGLAMSEDGVVWVPMFWRETPPTGNYAKRVVFDFPGGLGSYDNFAGIRLRTTERVTFNTDALFVEDGQ